MHRDIDMDTLLTYIVIQNPNALVISDVYFMHVYAMVVKSYTSAYVKYREYSRFMSTGYVYACMYTSVSEVGRDVSARAK